MNATASAFSDYDEKLLIHLYPPSGSVSTERAVLLVEADKDLRVSVGKLGIRVVGLTCVGWKADELRVAGCFSAWQDPADLLLNFEESALRR